MAHCPRWAQLNEQLAKGVPYASMSDSWHCSLGAAEGITYDEWMSAGAI